MNEPEFSADGIEPGRDVSGDPFAAMMDRIEQAADEYLMTAPEAARSDVVRGLMMHLSHWIAATYQIDERDCVLTISHSVSRFLQMMKGG